MIHSNRITACLCCQASIISWYFLRCVENAEPRGNNLTDFFHKRKQAITLNKNTCFMMLKEFWFPLLLCEFLGHVQ